MKSEIYTNRHGDKFTFTPTEEGNVIWEGKFEWSRYSYTEDGKHLGMVDPSGGPYLAENMPSTMAHSEIKGKKISHFIPLQSGGYEIVLKD